MGKGGEWPGKGTPPSKGGEPPSKGGEPGKGGPPGKGSGVAVAMAGAGAVGDAVSLDEFLGSHRSRLGPPTGRAESYCPVCGRLEIRPEWLARVACSVCRGPLTVVPDRRPDT